eukprot:evm.model.scf_366.4 EVM.evm.TU.scf_366.4   scf_366:58825-67959(+)
MHIAMGTSADPVGVLTRLEKPIFEGGVGECLRIREDDSRVGRPALGASGDDCVARTPGCSLENGGMASGGGEACEEGNKGGPGAEEGAEEGGEEGAGLAPVVFCAPADVSLIAKDSNKLTIQWGKSRRLEGPDPAGLAVRYTVETQQVDVPSGRETPNGEEAAALVNSDLWRAAAQTADSWAQIRGLRPGRYYAIRVAAAPRCDEPCLRLWVPAASAVAVFHTTPSAPGAPQPPQLTSRERTSLKVREAGDRSPGGRPARLSFRFSTGCGRLIPYSGTERLFGYSNILSRECPGRCVDQSAGAESRIGCCSEGTRWPAAAEGVSDGMHLVVSQFKWNVPESGGLNIIDFRLQLRPPPATAKDDVDEEVLRGVGFAEIFCGLQQSFRATKLLPGVKYTARVKARNELGEGPWSLHSVFTTEASVPAMPEPPRQVHVSSASVSLQWDAPKDNGARIDLYTLEAWNEEDDCFRPVYCGQSPQCAISDLESGATYRFKVRAENQAGKSKWSGTTIVHIAPSAPGPPRMLSCQSSTKTSASFSWAPPRYTGGSEISCYEGEVMPLSRPAGKSTWTTVYSGQAHSCSVGSLTPGCTYQIRVRASNAAGWGPKSQCTKFTSEPGVPDKVPVPTVVSLGSTSLKVSWKAPAHDGGSNITGYQLQCCEARKVASDSASVFKGVYYGSLCSWEAGGLLPGKEYAFRVQAVNACGASSWSTVTKGTTKAGVPDIPTPPTVRESSSDSLTLCWIPPDGRGSTVSSYTVQLAQEGGRCNGFVSHEEHRKACAGSTEGMGSGNEAEPLLDHGAGVSAGGMCSSCDGGALDFSDVYTGSQVQCRVPGLHAGTTYRVRLRASNKAGSSQWSKAVAFKTQAAAPSSPRNLQATEVSTNSVHLCWEHPLCDNGSKVCMYALERLSQRSKKVAWVQEYQGQATSTSYTVSTHNMRSSGRMFNSQPAVFS